MSKNIESCFTIHFTADFSGCGQLRTILINDMLNSRLTASGKYEGICSSRFILDKNILSQAKVIHFQRQITNEQMQFLKAVRNFRDTNNLKFKIIYDLDDNYLDVPEYNAAKNFYNQPFIKKNIIDVVNNVDIFTTSTYDLKKVIESYNGSCKVQVLPNYLPKYIYRPYEFIKTKNEKPKIVWAGSSTHYDLYNSGDLGLILDLIRNTYNEFDWVFMGVNNPPKWLKGIKDKIQYVDWVRSIHEFPTLLKSINADFGLAPLLDNNFNRSKSNIKLLDYASADIISICSDVSPYKKEAQLFLKNNWKEDRDQIIEIFNDTKKKEIIIEKQRKILDKYWLETAGIKKYKELYEID